MNDTDPDKLKRINDLAKQLFEYKLAQNMEDAYAQAQRIVDNESNLIVKRVGDKYVDPVKEKAAQSSGTGSHMPGMESKSKNEEYYMVSGYSDATDLRKLKIKVDDMEKILNAVMGKMNEMIAEINQLHQQRPVIQGQSTLVTNPQQEKKVVGVKMPDGSMSYPTTKEEVHPRTGAYTSSDVAIDKMFNFSGRR